MFPDSSLMFLTCVCFPTGVLHVAPSLSIEMCVCVCVLASICFYEFSVFRFVSMLHPDSIPFFPACFPIPYISRIHVVHVPRMGVLLIGWFG